MIGSARNKYAALVEARLAAAGSGDDATDDDASAPYAAVKAHPRTTFRGAPSSAIARTSLGDAPGETFAHHTRNRNHNYNHNHNHNFFDF